MIRNFRKKFSGFGVGRPNKIRFATPNETPVPHCAILSFSKMPWSSFVKQADIDAFRMRVLINLIERLILKVAFEEPVRASHLTAVQSRDALKAWLDINSSAADAAYGSRFRNDPAQSALYADEVKELIETMKRNVDGCYETWAESHVP